MQIRATLRCHVTLSELTLSKKRWHRGCGEAETLARCSVGQRLWKSVCCFFKMLNRVSDEPASPLTSREKCKHMTSEAHVHNWSQCSYSESPQTGTVQIPVNGRMSKQNVTYLYCKYYLTTQKGASYSREETWKHCGSWEKPVMRAHVLYYARPVKYPESANLWEQVIG